MLNGVTCPQKKWGQVNFLTSNPLSLEGVLGTSGLTVERASTCLHLSRLPVPEDI